MLEEILNPKFDKSNRFAIFIKKYESESYLMAIADYVEIFIWNPVWKRVGVLFRKRYWSFLGQAIVGKHPIDMFELAWSFDHTLIKQIVPGVIEQVGKYTVLDYERADGNLQHMANELLELGKKLEPYLDNEDDLCNESMKCIMTDFAKSKELMDARKKEYDTLRLEYMQKLSVLLPYLRI